MFKVGYWYKYIGKNYWEMSSLQYAVQKYSQITKWNKCIKINDKIVYLKNENIHSFHISWIRWFIESKYHPDIKKKIRMILND